MLSRSLFSMIMESTTTSSPQAPLRGSNRSRDSRKPSLAESMGTIDRRSRERLTSPQYMPKHCAGEALKYPSQYCRQKKDSEAPQQVSQGSPMDVCDSGTMVVSMTEDSGRNLVTKEEEEESAGNLPQSGHRIVEEMPEQVRYLQKFMSTS